MLASPGQEAWITPELLEDDELDEELDDEELDEDELDELDEDELDEDELDEEPGGFSPPQPPTVNNDNKQALTIARFTVNTLFMQPLSNFL